ncbi:hypothetical protein HRI_004717300 [Hibiscus trionum]|uniref:Uncharacterized protein n=1 Tax=Hibiscus trionum TaxID=183268 RepID=A0A9W7MV39_HIBTR|nr:hypothetical protein HRI_004717300 [Hibiscus trionum]
MTLLSLNLKPTISLSSSSFLHLHPPFSPIFSPKTQTFSTRIHNLQYPSLNLSFSRRLFILPSVSGIWEALTGNNNAREAVIAIRRGMLLFRRQRGLSLYYLDRFKEGAEQFRLDVAQNPNDTEELIWCFLCEAQLLGVDEARRRFLEVSNRIDTANLSRTWWGVMEL